MNPEETFESLEAFERKYGPITYKCKILGKEYLFTENSVHLRKDATFQAEKGATEQISSSVSQ